MWSYFPHKHRHLFPLAGPRARARRDLLGHLATGLMEPLLLAVSAARVRDSRVRPRGGGWCRTVPLSVTADVSRDTVLSAKEREKELLCGILTHSILHLSWSPRYHAQGKQAQPVRRRETRRVRSSSDVFDSGMGWLPVRKVLRKTGPVSPPWKLQLLSCTVLRPSPGAECGPSAH